MDSGALQTLSDIPHMGGLDDSPRGRVLRAAAHLFCAQGYERTTVRDLAKIVGIQSGSLFHHFKTKEDILCAVMEEAILYSYARMEEAVAKGRTPREQLLGLIRAELESINGDTGDAMSVLVYEWNALSAEKQQYLLAMRERYEALWLSVLEDARKEGMLHHDAFIWRRLLSGAIGWTRMWYKRNGPLSLDAVAEMTLEMALGR
ncbi:MAG: TetR/AcrR family transcriptional regulator [bacterium]|jgi:AcrR family transcriptional regulator|nr:TetR/AcrR family transcriptional regulator [bacterium]